MKKIIALVLSLITTFSCAIPIFGATSVEIEKKEMLESIERQLIAQDAERFLPIYEQYLDLAYSTQTEMYSIQATKSGAPYETTFSNGGMIYYEDFLDTGVEMCNTYLSNKMYKAAYASPTPSNYFKGLVNDVAVAIGLTKATKSLVIGGFYATFAYIYNENDKEILRAGAAYSCVTRDNEGYAQITLPWKNSPKASYYAGAEIEWF